MTSQLDPSKENSMVPGSVVDPEFVRTGQEEDPPREVTWKERLSFLGILRLIVGQIRDSSGRPNNILGLLYAAMIFFFAGIWWSLSPAPQRHILDVYCGGTTRATPVPKKDQKATSKAQKYLEAMKSRLVQQKAQKHTFRCSGATIQATVNLPSRPSLPASFYWVLVIPFCCLLIAYLSRRPEMRRFMLDLLFAYRQQGGVGINWKDRIFEVFASQEKKIDELSPTTENKVLPPEPSKEREH